MPPDRTSPIPPAPTVITIPNIKVTTETDGTIQVPAAEGFFYAGVQAVWIWWSADLDLLRSYLEPYRLTPYDFGGGKGAVNINFFNSAALYGSGTPGNNGISGFNETEVNIAAYASKVGDKVPQGMTLKQYLTVGEQTKRVGNFRLWVACDDAIAVAFGQQAYFENKFLCSYKYTAPSPNLPSATTWDWTCYDSPKGDSTIYQCGVDLTGMKGFASNMSEWIDLSHDQVSGRPVGSRRNYFGMFHTYQVPRNGSNVTLEYGKSKHSMRHDMKRLIGTRRPAFVQHYASPTCIAEATPYFADL